MEAFCLIFYHNITQRLYYVDYFLPLVYNINMNSRKIENLGYNNLVILQDDNLYKFTTDAVLLANVVSCKGKKVADMCSGGGIISILLAGKKMAKQVVGIELQGQLADMSRQSVALNHLEDVVSIVCGDVSKVCSQYKGYFDIVVCNPPYRKVGSGQQQRPTHLALCRHEIALTLQQVISSASMMLNNRGCFYLVHQANRIAEICYIAKQHNIEIKHITPIASKVGKEPNLVIVKGVKGGNVDCTIDETLYIYDDKGNYTPLVHSYYNSEE